MTERQKIDRLRRSLKRARDAWMFQLEVDLEACCPHGSDGKRIESQMDRHSRPMIAETRRLIAGLDSTLRATA